MTAHILSSELSTLIQESKKKNAELRTAADHALQDLKALPATSEAQLATDLQRRPHFINPFLLACKTKNPKLCLPAVTCLQRLIGSSGLGKERLKEVLDGFQECVGSSLEIQLKILQSLPSLLQNYATVLQDDLYARVLRIYTILQQVKAVAVASTASATLQQAVSYLFEKVELEDDRVSEEAGFHDISVNDDILTVGDAAFDAYRTLTDICLMVEAEPPQFVRKASLSPGFGLELIETVLLGHEDLFHSHRELSYLLSQRVMPLINRVLAEKQGYSITVRTTRIFCILLREYLTDIKSEAEVALGLFNQVLDSENSSPWRRALCMETFRVLYSSSDLVINVYSLLDYSEKKRGIIQTNLATFVRLASEKPNVIGVGQQSSIPSTQTVSKTSSQEQAVIDAGNAAGMIVGDFGVSEVNAPGISEQWSTLKVPCLDQLDKAEPPHIPETYIYSLVLACMTNLSDVLAKLILPVSMQNQSKSSRKSRAATLSTQQKSGETEEKSSNNEFNRVESLKRRERSIPVNPLDLKDHPTYSSIRTVVDLLNACWPAILATSSTFLYAALDGDFYRGLVRSIQKFTQISGLLRLATPRDAFLTTLAKAAVPSYLFKTDSAYSPGTGTPTTEYKESARGLVRQNSSESAHSQASVDSPTRSRRPSFDLNGPTLTQRNLMCLRALVNLAIALGPILDSGWQIVLENVQKASVLIAVSGTAASARDFRSSQSNDQQATQPSLSSEIVAVEGAVTRMFQSTSDYSNESFNTMLSALCNLLRSDKPLDKPVFLQTPLKSPRRVSSTSGLPSSVASQPQLSHFAIAKIGELAHVNLNRLTYDAENGGWELLTKTATEVCASGEEDASGRLMAVQVVADTAAETAILSSSEDEGTRREVQQRSLAALRAVLTTQRTRQREGATYISDTDVHVAVLESLHSILERCGESLIIGWPAIFEILNSAFAKDQRPLSAENGAESKDTRRESISEPVSGKLLRPSFSSIQLICSDFLDALPKPSNVSLVDLLSKFCAQRIDMNMSLTAITLFWNVSDFFQTHIERFSFEIDVKEGSQSLERADLIPMAQKGSLTAMWMILQQNLAAQVSDQRTDVRNGAVYTIWRMLRNCGDQLTNAVWTTSIHSVVFNLLTIDIQRQELITSKQDSINPSDLRSINGTSNIIITGSAELFSTYLETLSRLDDFSDLWHSLLEHFVSYLDCESFELTKSILRSLATTFEAAEDTKNLRPSLVNEVASLWARNIPQGSTSVENGHELKNEAFVAYVDVVKQIYRLLESELSSKHSEIIVDRLQACVEASTAIPYSNDLSSITHLQAEVLGFLKRMRLDLDKATSKITSCLARFIVLPYDKADEARDGNALTFVAFAKSSIDMVSNLIVTHGNKSDIYISGATASALESLARSIELQYNWQRQGKEPSLWRKATESSIAIVKTILPATGSLKLSEAVTLSLWNRIIQIISAIHDTTYTTQPSDSTLIPDESFDLTSSATLRAFTTPYLCLNTLPTSIRTMYIASLTRSSLAHTSRFDPLPTLQPSQSPAHLLSNLHTIRMGRTYDPPFNPRIRISYACFDELFSLAAATRSTSTAPEHATNGTTSSADVLLLAKTALPFLIARCALPLKSFIADQPLRGRMPTPTSQRLELLYILKQLRELRCPAEAFEELEREMINLDADAGDDGRTKGMPKTGFRVLDSRRRHLEFIVPLVSRAIVCAGRDDGEMKMEMQRVLDVVSEGR